MNQPRQRKDTINLALNQVWQRKVPVIGGCNWQASFIL
jgi:hypothetical protein